MNVYVRDYHFLAMMRSILLVVSFWAVVVQPFRSVEKFCQRNEGSCIFLDKNCFEDCAKQATDSYPSLEAPTGARSASPDKEANKQPEDLLYVINSDIFTLKDQDGSHPYLKKLGPSALDNILTSDATSELSMSDMVGGDENPSLGNNPCRGGQRYRRTPRRSSLQDYKKPYSKSLIPSSTKAPTTTLPPVRVNTLPPHVGFSYDGKLFDKTCKPICEYNGQYFPHPVECNKFYHCAGSTPYEKDCPQTTSFDTESGVCEYAYDAINDLCDPSRDCSGNGY